jgi:hypothetical protein
MTQEQALQKDLWDSAAINGKDVSFIMRTLGVAGRCDELFPCRCFTDYLTEEICRGRRRYIPGKSSNAIARSHKFG